MLYHRWGKCWVFCSLIIRTLEILCFCRLGQDLTLTELDPVSVYTCILRKWVWMDTTSCHFYKEDSFYVLVEGWENPFSLNGETVVLGGKMRKSSFLNELSFLWSFANLSLLFAGGQDVISIKLAIIFFLIKTMLGILVVF